MFHYAQLKVTKPNPNPNLNPIVEVYVANKYCTVLICVITL